MSQDKIIQICDLCGDTYQHGPHRYEGHKAPKYGIIVCDVCWSGNWDGWNPSHEGKLLISLKKNNLIVPERNDKGLLPR